MVNSFKVVNDSYIECDNTLYEKLDVDSSSIDIELDLECYKHLVEYMRSEGFLSIGETVRHILREIIKDKKLLEDFKSGRGVSLDIKE